MPGKRFSDNPPWCAKPGVWPSEIILREVTGRERGLVTSLFARLKRPAKEEDWPPADPPGGPGGGTP